MPLIGYWSKQMLLYTCPSPHLGETNGAHYLQHRGFEAIWKRLLFYFPGLFFSMHVKRKLHPKHSHKSRRKNPSSPNTWEVRMTGRRWAFISRGRQLERALLEGRGASCSLFSSSDEAFPWASVYPLVNGVE